MNEENGNRGGKIYAEIVRKGEAFICFRIDRWF